MTRPVYLVGIASLLIFRMASGQIIDANVSVKVIVDPNTGQRDPGITDQLIRDGFAACNEVMATYWRGYRYRLTEITNVGALNDVTGPGKWFNASDSGANLHAFEREALTNTAYRWRTNAANVYVRYGLFEACQAGGACAVPALDSKCDRIYGVCWVNVSTEGWVFNHEVGHHFDLMHTHQNGGLECDPSIIVDDLISDTLFDAPSWSRDQIAGNAYGLAYASLNPWQQENVNNTYFNVMSYHECTNRQTLEIRMTEGQLDRWADAANGVRRSEVTGRTWFVRPGTLAVGNGSSTNEYRRVASAASSAGAAGADIIVLRPGSYNEQLTISSRVTLRAMRTTALTNRWVTIGRP